MPYVKKFADFCPCDPINLLTIPLGPKGSCSHQIMWPVTRDEGFLYFESAAGELSISRRAWAEWQQELQWPYQLIWGGLGDQTRQLAWFDDLPKKLMSCLERLDSISGRRRVELAGVKDGSTQASRTVTLKVALLDADGKIARKITRSRTVPFSLLEQDCKGLTTLPYWFCIKNRLIGEKETLAMHPWVGFDRLKESITPKILEAKDDYLKMLANAREAEERRATRQKMEEESKAEAKAKIEARDAQWREITLAEGEPVLAYVRAKYTLSDLREEGVNWNAWPDWILADGPDKVYRILPPLIDKIKAMPDYQAWLTKHDHKRGSLLKRKVAREREPRQPDQVLENCAVSWVEWVGPSNSRQRQLHSAEGCTVQIFGKKYLIELATGEIFTKMQGPNLKIIAPSDVVDLLHKLQ